MVVSFLPQKNNNLKIFTPDYMKAVRQNHLFQPQKIVPFPCGIFFSLKIIMCALFFVFYASGFYPFPASQSSVQCSLKTLLFLILCPFFVASTFPPSSFPSHANLLPLSLTSFPFEILQNCLQVLQFVCPDFIFT